MLALLKRYINAIVANVFSISIGVALAVFTVIVASANQGKFAYGTGNIQTTGKNTVVHINTDTSAIEWSRLRVRSGAVLEYRVPHSNSLVLNQVTENSPTIIDGKILSKDLLGNRAGNILFANPNGFLFGANSMVDVGSIGVFAARIKDYSTLGERKFSFIPGSGAIIFNGVINANTHGSVLMFANKVINSGKISVEGGTVSLSNFPDGKAVRIFGDGLINFILADSQSVNRQESGTVVPTSIDQIKKAVIDTAGLEIGSMVIEDDQGNIIISGGLDSHIDSNGEIDVSGHRGGKIEISSNNIFIGDESYLNASGELEGGIINLGKDIFTKYIEIGGKAKIKANSNYRRPAGKISITGEENIFRGSIEAKGTIVDADGFVSQGGEITFNGTNITLTGYIDTISDLESGHVGNININSNGKTQISNKHIAPYWIQDSLLRNNIKIGDKQSSVYIRSAMTLPDSNTKLIIAGHNISMESPVFSEGASLELWAYNNVEKLNINPFVFSKTGQINFKKGNITLIYNPLSYSARHLDFTRNIFAKNVKHYYWVNNSNDWNSAVENVNINIALGKDIDFIGQDYKVPAMSSSRPFTGSILGMGNSLSNIVIRSENQSHSLDHVLGIFGHFDGEAVGINIDNVKIIGGDNFVIGTFAGLASPNAFFDDIKLSNINIKAGNNSQIGGFAGRIARNFSSPEIRDIQVLSTSLQGGMGTNIGGLASYTKQSKFRNIVTDVQINGKGGVVSNEENAFSNSSYGGIVAHAYQSHLHEGFAYGNIDAGEYSNVGGVFGFLDASTAFDSGASGKMRAKEFSNLGGFVGVNYLGEVHYSYATGEVGSLDKDIARNITQGGFFGKNMEGGFFNNRSAGKAFIGEKAIHSLTGGFGGYNAGVASENISSTVIHTGGAIPHATEGSFFGTNKDDIGRRNFYDDEINSTFKGSGNLPHTLFEYKARGRNTESFIETSGKLRKWVAHAGEHLINIAGLRPMLSAEKPRFNRDGIAHIRTPEEFQLMLLDPKGDYSLQRSINLDTKAPENIWGHSENIHKKPTTQGFIPINFQGNFYGNGYAIEGVHFYADKLRGKSLFGDILNAGIYDINIVGSFIGDDYSSGGFLAHTAKGYNQLHNISIDADVQIKNRATFGGMVGSVASASVLEIGNGKVELQAKNNGKYSTLGGFVGSGGRIYINRSVAHVRYIGGKHSYQGGFIGSQMKGVAYIRESLALTDFTKGKKNIFGLFVGYDTGVTTIHNSYWLNNSNSKLIGLDLNRSFLDSSSKNSVLESKIGLESSYPSWKFVSSSPTANWAMAKFPISTKGHSYALSKPEHILMMAVDPYGKYKLTKDIDLSETHCWSNGNGLTLKNFIFRGELDGYGYSFDNFYRKLGAESYGGLIPELEGAVVRNIALSGKIDATDMRSGNVDRAYVGLIAGDIRDSKIFNTDVRGHVRGGDSLSIGGIAGKMDENSLLEGGLSSVNIKAGRNVIAAPIVANNHGEIKRVIAKKSSVELVNGIAAGFVGINEKEGRIFDSAAVRNLFLKGKSASESVGENYGKIEGLYVESHVNRSLIGEHGRRSILGLNKGYMRDIYVEDKPDDSVSSAFNLAAGSDSVHNLRKVNQATLDENVNLSSYSLLPKLFAQKYQTGDRQYIYGDSIALNISFFGNDSEHNNITVAVSYNDGTRKFIKANNINKYTTFLDANKVDSNALVSIYGEQDEVGKFYWFKLESGVDDYDIYLEEDATIRAPKNSVVYMSEMIRSKKLLESAGVRPSSIPINSDQGRDMFAKLGDFAKRQILESTKIPFPVIREKYLQKSINKMSVNRNFIIDAPFVLDRNLLAENISFVKPVYVIKDTTLEGKSVFFAKNAPIRSSKVNLFILANNYLELQNDFGLEKFTPSRLFVGGGLKANVQGNLRANGLIHFLSPINLSGDTSIVSTNNSILFGDTLNGSFPLYVGARQDITFSGDVGSKAPLASIKIDPKTLRVDVGGSFRTGIS